jgi:hypothetical protein
MQEDARQRFQGLCLWSDEGRAHMDCFDEMPEQAREAVRNSPFNICAACLLDKTRELDGDDDNLLYIQALHNMEELIREQESAGVNEQG